MGKSEEEIMAGKHSCIWCGRMEEESRLVAGPVIHLCEGCIKRLAGTAESEAAGLAARVREEVDREVQKSFQEMVKQLNLGPLQEKYQRLMRVKFKEEPGSPTFQEVFQEFKKGVAAVVAEDDYQTRYDLAIAYHEMGLMEDAFREMLQSLAGSLRQKDFDRASEIMSALLYFHDDAARVVKGIGRVLGEARIEKL